ncbi:MAG TPA: hypothetical protein VHN18_12910 [Micromonosporaceae bacterium]|nr:hypothetical protein [Micromonosporaceae bacterium]
MGVTGEAATGREGRTAPTKKAAVKKAAAKKAAKKVPAKEAATKIARGQGGPDLEPPAAEPVKAARPARKKPAPRKAAVPKQPGAEPGHAKPGHADPGQAEPAHTVPAPAEPPANEPPTLAREAPPVEGVPTSPVIDDVRRVAVRLLDDPAHAPELLAAAAVRLIGPRAAAWADAVRSAYPGATDEGLARLATRRFVQLAAVGGMVSSAAGVFAPAAELATAALARAGLVLHIAAAHGHDPGDPDRAAELLVLTQVHADESAARAALKAAVETYGQGRVIHDAPPLARAAEAGLRLAVPLAAEAGGWGLLRLAARVVPGARVIAATAGQVAAAERLATRASAYYRRQAPARAS